MCGHQLNPAMRIVIVPLVPSVVKVLVNQSARQIQVVSAMKGAIFHPEHVNLFVDAMTIVEVEKFAKALFVLLVAEVILAVHRTKLVSTVSVLVSVDFCRFL